MGDINCLCLSCLQYTLNDQGICDSCGSPSVVSAQSSHHMQPRSILAGKYMVARVLGEGGFGITYLGWDINLEVKIAIKEYFPLGAATRNTTVSDQVSAPAGNAEEQYQQGQERFIDEARRLAKLHSLPGIVAVKDFFLENGTAYIVMEFVEGVTLKSYLEQSGGRMPAENVLALMKPLIKSLAQIHRTGIIHRDISPDNIMVTPEGQLRLIDFGAARDFASDNKSMSVLLKPGYAPEEQYRSRGNQGPWTDIYALCATIYRAIEGEKPQEALERVLEDTMSGFTAAVPENAAAAIMKGLNVRQEGRWKNLDEFYAALYQEATQQKPQSMTMPAAASAPPVVQQPTANEVMAPQAAMPQEAKKLTASAASDTPASGKKRKGKPIIAAAIAVVVLLAIVIPVMTQNQSGLPQSTMAAQSDVGVAASLPAESETADNTPASEIRDGEFTGVAIASDNAAPTNIASRIWGFRLHFQGDTTAAPAPAVSDVALYIDGVAHNISDFSAVEPYAHSGMTTYDFVFDSDYTQCPGKYFVELLVNGIKVCSATADWQESGVVEYIHDAPDLQVRPSLLVSGENDMTILEPPDIQFMVNDIVLLETTIGEVWKTDHGDLAVFENDSLVRYHFWSRDDTVVDYVVLQDTDMPFELLGKYRFGEAAPTLFTDFTGIADYHSLPYGDHMLFDDGYKRLEVTIYSNSYYLDYTQGDKRLMINVDGNIIDHFDMRHVDIV